MEVQGSAYILTWPKGKKQGGKEIRREYIENFERSNTVNISFSCKNQTNKNYRILY